MKKKGLAKMYSQAQIIELLINALPYPNQIKDIDLISEKDSVRFTWRSARYRVNTNVFVEEVKGGCLASSDAAILICRCLEQSAVLKSISA